MTACYIFFYGTGMDQRYAQKGDSLFKLYEKAVEKVGKDYCFRYNGPGSYQNEKGLSAWFSPKEWVNYSFSFLGTLTGGHGPNNWHSNIDDAITNIKKLNPRPDHIYIAGHSRGAVTAFMLANQLNKDLELKHIQVSVIGFDPVANIDGMYQLSNSQSQLRDNVSDCHIFLASECRLFGFTSIIPSVPETTKLKVFKVPTHHNGVINLDIGLNVLNHDTLKTNPDTAELCLTYSLKAFNLPYLKKDYYQEPSLYELRRLRSAPNNLSKQKTVKIFKVNSCETLNVDYLEATMLSKEAIEDDLKAESNLFFAFEAQVNRDFSSYLSK